MFHLEYFKDRSRERERERERGLAGEDKREQIVETHVKGVFQP